MQPGQQPGMPQGQPQPPKVKHYDLRKGIYTVSVSIGKQRQTALQEGAEEIGQILQARPEMMPIIGPLYFQYREFPGAKQLADLLKKMRDQQFPFLAEGNEGEAPEPEQLQSQIQQMGQQIEEMQKQLQGAAQQIETDQAKQQAMLQKAEMDNQTKLQIAKLESETRLQLENMKAEISSGIEGIKGQLAQMAGAAKMEHESGEKERDRQHDVDVEVTKAVLAPPELEEHKGAADEPLKTEG